MRTEDALVAAELTHRVKTTQPAIFLGSISVSMAATAAIMTRLVASTSKASS
jgi:hypothetical protein